MGLGYVQFVESWWPTLAGTTGSWTVHCAALSVMSFRASRVFIVTVLQKRPPEPEPALLDAPHGISREAERKQL